MEVVVVVLVFYAGTNVSQKIIKLGTDQTKALLKALFLAQLPQQIVKLPKLRQSLDDMVHLGTAYFPQTASLSGFINSIQSTFKNRLKLSHSVN